MNLPEQIREEMKNAMRAKDATKLMVMRGLLSAFTNELVSQGKTPQETLSDEDALAVIKREAKRRKDSIQQFTDGGRADLAENEKAELDILSEFLPSLLTKEEITSVVKAKIMELGVSDKSGIGKLIGAVIAELGARADGNDVKEVAQELLN